MSKKASLIFLGILGTFLLFIAAHVVWYEFGPEGQKRNAISECIKTRSVMAINDPTIPYENLGEILDNIMIGCKEENE